MEAKPKRRVKAKQKPAAVDFVVGDAFDVATAKDKDFDLDLDAAKFQGKKGQAGSRSKGVA